MRIFNAYTNFKTYGGAELIAINLTKGLVSLSLEVSLLSNSKREEFHKDYQIDNLAVEKLSIGFIKSLKRDDILISHHRKITTMLLLLKKMHIFKAEIIHVAHNEFYNLKPITLFPNKIIAVSNRVKENLITYFGIDECRIEVIYNGVEDTWSGVMKDTQENTIRVLYPARLTDVKQQVSLVKNLINRIDKNIEIHFAGTGPDLSILEALVSGNKQFKILGFVDLKKVISQYDYVMLFSKVEGLPTVFIEACMHSKPIICNNVGGNMEILTRDKNGFLANNFEELVTVLNSLSKINSTEYQLLCQNSRYIYKQKFTYHSMIEKYLKLVQTWQG